MTIGDDSILRVTLKGTVQLQEMVNVFHYFAQISTGAVEDTLAQFATAFQSDVVVPIAGIINNQSQFTYVKIEGVEGNNETYETAFAPIVGTRTGEAMPPFVAWEYQLLRATSATRHGWKRFGGIAEPDHSNGVPNPTFQATLDALAATLYAGFDTGTVPFTKLYSPILASYIVNGMPRVTPVFNSVNNIIYKRVTSQNTRKFGRGS